MVSFPQVSPTKPYIHSPPVRATCLAQRILLDVITRTILCEEYRSLSSSIRSFLHSPITSSLSGPNILLSTLFTNTVSPRSSLNVSDQVSHPYKIRRKIIVLQPQLHKFTFFFLSYDVQVKVKLSLFTPLRARRAGGRDTTPLIFDL